MRELLETCVVGGPEHRGARDDTRATATASDGDATPGAVVELAVGADRRLSRRLSAPAAQAVTATCVFLCRNARGANRARHAFVAVRYAGDPGLGDARLDTLFVMSYDMTADAKVARLSERWSESGNPDAVLAKGGSYTELRRVELDEERSRSGQHQDEPEHDGAAVASVSRADVLRVIAQGWAGRSAYHDPGESTDEADPPVAGTNNCVSFARELFALLVDRAGGDAG